MIWQKMGADHSVLNVKNMKKKLHPIDSNEGVDLVILTANPWDTYISSLKSVEPEGRISIVAYRKRRGR